MLKKTLKPLLLILLNCLMFSCATTPPDVPLCTQLSPTRGYCVYTISSKEYEINETQLMDGKTWWEIKPMMIFMPSQSWVEIKKFIIKICEKSKKCKTDNVENWQSTVSKIDKKIVN